MKVFKKEDTVEGFRKCRKTAHAEAVRVEEPFAVETLEGTMIGNAGDYLMRGVQGELYPCAAEIFERTYEWVGEEPSEPPAANTPESHLRSIQAMFVEFGMRAPELVPTKDDHTAELKLQVDEDSWYRITCYALQKGLHTIVTHPCGTLFEGYSRVRSFAAVQNHLAKHVIAVQDVLGQIPVEITGKTELPPDFLSADYGTVPSPSAAELREEITRLRKLADDICPPFSSSVRASLAADTYRKQADGLEAKLSEADRD